MKMSGYVMAGLASIEKEERLVENGLTINNTFLREFPYRRKAEIILGNLLIAVREENIIEALRRYCRVVSLAYEVVSCNGYTWTTGNRKAFVLLNEGRKLHQLPVKWAQNWTDIIESSEAGENGFIQPLRKRKRGGASTPDSRLPRATATARTEVRSFNRTSRNSGGQTSSTMRTQPQNIKATRQRVADDRSMQQSSSLDNCVFVEFCPDFTQLQYFQTLVKLFGDHRAILQLANMNGHVLVGLSTTAFAERLIDEGLTIEDTLLRVCAYQKRADKIIISNLPFCVQDSGVFAALRPYGQVTSIAPVYITIGEYTVMDSRREAFTMLNDGLKIHQLPTRIDIKVGGETIPAFLSHGIRCNKCHQLGHRRVNCPQNPKAAAEPHQAPSPQKSTASLESMRGWLPAPAPMPPVHDTTAAASIPVAHAPVLPAQATPATIVTDKVLTEQHAIDIAFVQEANVTTLDNEQDLCFGYKATIAPSTSTIGSGLACVAAPGVTILWQRILWPGKIAVVCANVRGHQMAFVNCHLSHALDERLLQLQTIAAEAFREDAWVLGDLNISEESTSDINSGSVEALTELLEQVDLVDAAYIFEATHLPTRVVTFESRIDTSRLDRILLPSRLSDHVTHYWTTNYRLSDHRAVILQLGQPPPPRPTCIAAMLRSRIVVVRVATLFDEASSTITDLSNRELWRNWTTIKSHGGPGLNGYRPISIPTTDYRVLSSVLLGRLRPHLPRLVPKCQTYAVPGRSSSLNIARVSDEVAAASRNNTPLAVISTDLESAFDTLDRGFLISLLVSLRLPPAFIGWLLVLYAGADATVRVSKHYTRPFHLLNGVKQGCAASAALFSIATGQFLRRLERVLGQGNVLAYADDINLLIRNDEQFKLVKNIFDEFRLASGVRINYSKCKGLWCGSWRNRVDSPLDICWSTAQLKVLGCLVTTGHGTSVQENHLVELMETAAARWSSFVRSLSLVERARAANSLVLSSVVHHLHGYLPTDSTISKLQARLVRFVWGPGRTAWLPGGVLARPVSMGGFGLLDVGTQLRLACMKGVQASLRGSLNAYSWLTDSGAWLTPLPSGTWLPPRRRRLLKIWEAVSDFLALDHRIAPTQQLRDLAIIGGCRFLRPPDLLAAARLGEAVVLRGTVTPLMRLTTRTIRRTLERPRLATLPIVQLLYRWQDFVDIPFIVGCPSLRRCAFSGHNADIAVQLALHAFPHPAHPASARETCIACGSSDLTLAHRYWSCSSIRPLIREAFNIIQQPPDLQGWLFGQGLDDDALAILASAKSSIHRSTREQKTLNKARSAVASFDQCCYIEWRGEFHSLHYMKALEEMLEKGSVYQLMKMSGHVLFGLASIEKAKRLVEEGLTINNTFLRAFPYRRKTEKIVIGNLPIEVKEEDIVGALRPYCRVVSLAYDVVSCDGYTWTTGNREAFVFLNEGRKLIQLPAKLVIIFKGEFIPAYITYGVSRCHRQGHRRATCPLGINGGHHQDTRQGPVSKPPSSKLTPSNNSAFSTSAKDLSAPSSRPRYHPPALLRLCPGRTSLSIPKILRPPSLLFRCRAPASFHHDQSAPLPILSL
ncbi:hypothetical protein LAZ67_3001246 [Cordylochernes scorpioides]|uniref:Reverse transcriptase domain-containing protein n=1 Tax=Cordylochernes scorpioides TaxID=51811 RepID=A0ABY6K8C7_9ARAC|nr:hypothetical protein LAZ67_3001246 [Cordylochernes scorpioides]